MKSRFFTTALTLLMTLLPMSKTAYSQTSSDSTIVLSVTDYTKIVNGLVRLQELDTLYNLCKEDVALADSQIVKLDSALSLSDQKILLYKDDLESLKTQLNTSGKKIARRNKWLTVLGGAFVATFTFAVLK